MFEILKADEDTNTVSRVETVWSMLKVPLLDAATEICGLSKNHPLRPETWWWNEQVDEAIQKKHVRFKVYKALRKGGKMAEAKEAKTAYIDTKHVAKHTVWLARSEAEKEEFATVSLNVYVMVSPYHQTDESHKPGCW